MSIASRINEMTEHLGNDWDSINALGMDSRILPAEYTQVDYIESSGSQYIDTGVNADNNLRVVIDFAYTSISSANQNIGAIRLESGNNARYHILLGGNPTNNRIRIFVNDGGYYTINDDTNRHLYDINPSIGQVLVDNTSYTIPSDIRDVGLNFWLFGRNSTSTLYYSRVKQWACKMYYNNVLVRDFIPCYRNSDNEVGLYDLVNDVFYTNEGTGVFTYGEIQEENINRNIENIKVPLTRLYDNISDKTDLSVNGIVGRTSQESTTGKNLLNTNNIATGTINGIAISYNSETQEITLNGTCTYDNTQILISTNEIEFTSGVTKMIAYYVGGSVDVSQTIDNRLLFRTFRGGGQWDLYAGVNVATLSGSNPIVSVTSGGVGTKSRTDFRVDKNTVLTNFKIKLMITDSSDTEWEKFTYGESPNPSYPQPINNLSGDVPYKVSGKNKLPFPYTEQTHTHNGVTFTINNDGSVLVNGTATGGNANTKLYGNYQETKQLKLPAKYLVGGTNNVRLRVLHNEAGNYTVLANDTGSGAEIDTSRYDTGYIELTVLNGTTVNNVLVKPMGLDSLEDTTYEPYISQTFTIPLGDIELCNIDTYEDAIYSSDGRFYLNKNIKNHLFTTSDNIQKGASSTDGYARCGWGLSSEIATSDFDKILVKCNKFLGMSQNNNDTSLTGEHWYCSLSNTDNYKIMFRCGDTEYTRDTFPELIKNNEIIVYYPLKEPTTTEITTSNYPQLYAVLKQIQDYLTSYKINKEFILGYDSPEIEY